MSGKTTQYHHATQVGACLVSLVEDQLIHEFNMSRVHAPGRGLWYEKKASSPHILFGLRVLHGVATGKIFIPGSQLRVLVTPTQIR